MSQETHIGGLRAADESPLLGTGALIAGLALAVALIFPRTSPFVLLLLVSIPAAMVIGSGLHWAGLGRPPVAVALLMAAYLLVNSLWSDIRLDALGKSLLFTAIVLGVWVSRRGLARLPAASLRRLVVSALAGFVASLLYLLIEEYSAHLIKRTVFNLLPFTRPDVKHIAQLEGGRVADVYLYISNRSIGLVTLALWPMLMLTAWGGLFGPGNRRWIATGAVLALAAATLAQSQHETSEIALVLSLAAAVMAFWWRRLALVLVAVAWAVSTLLVVPIASHAYQTQKLYLNKSIPMSARHRIIIWGYTAELIPNAPLLGIGIESGKVRDARARHEQPPDHEYPRRTGTHSHNVYVQTWYELGAVGAVLLFAMGLSILIAIGRLDSAKQPFALATFVAAAAMAAFSWGMWQPWFMAGFGLAAMLFMIAAERVRRVERGEPASV